MATTRLKLYNGALRLLKERPLATLSDNVESRRILDAIWDDDALDRCLGMGRWTFATRTIELTYSPSVSADFGYPNAFDKPSDFIRTAAICADGYFDVPLLRYADEGSYWWCDLETIYVKYVSNDAAYGLDYSLWPGNFAAFVSSYLARHAAGPLSKDEGDAEKTMARLLSTALNTDAMSGPTVFAPRGGWANSRGNSRSNGRGPDR